MRLLHEIAIFQTVKSKVIISLFETVRLSVSISLRNLYNLMNSIKEKTFLVLIHKFEYHDTCSLASQSKAFSSVILALVTRVSGTNN